jgi:hypothetical protein
VAEANPKAESSMLGLGLHFTAYTILPELPLYPSIEIDHPNFLTALIARYCKTITPSH